MSRERERGGGGSRASRFSWRRARSSGWPLAWFARQRRVSSVSSSRTLAPSGPCASTAGSLPTALSSRPSPTPRCEPTPSLSAVPYGSTGEHTTASEPCSSSLLGSTYWSTFHAPRIPPKPSPSPLAPTPPPNARHRARRGSTHSSTHNASRASAESATQTKLLALSARIMSPPHRPSLCAGRLLRLPVRCRDSGALLPAGHSHIANADHRSQVSRTSCAGAHAHERVASISLGRRQRWLQSLSLGATARSPPVPTGAYLRMGWQRSSALRTAASPSASFLRARTSARRGCQAS
eukprot:scaffold263053_cov32-Tisochrysis_lutea.AAC.8